MKERKYRRKRFLILDDEEARNPRKALECYLEKDVELVRRQNLFEVEIMVFRCEGRIYKYNSLDKCFIVRE